MADVIGVIPVEHTLFSPLNFAVTGSLLVLIPLLLWRMMPRDPAKMVTYPLEAREAEHDDDAGADAATNFVGVLEQTRLVNLTIGLLLVGVLVDYFAKRGIAGWNLDAINLIFLTPGILLHRSPASYVAAVADGAKGSTCSSLRAAASGR